VSCADPEPNFFGSFCLSYLFPSLWIPNFCSLALVIRHNIGFFFIDFLAGVNGLRADTLKMQGLFCQGRAYGGQIFFVKPQTYMNRSGDCVRGFVEYFKIPLEHILVLHDDIDLSAGRIKIVSKGGAGGHNGVRSIAQHLGTQNFGRMKIGVGRPIVSEERPAQPVDQFVLSKMTEAELRVFHQRENLVEEAVALFVREGIDICMNRINGR
jgi:PTH1 family peptidyl-tRNA hydrolase